MFNLLVPSKIMAFKRVSANFKQLNHLIECGAWLYAASHKTKKIVGGTWGRAPHPPEKLIKHIEKDGVLGLIPASLGLVCLDLDSDTALDWFQQWSDKLGKGCKPLLITATRTEGRKHVYFRCPPVTNRAELAYPSGDLLPRGNVDVRGSKGYVILWGDTLETLSNALLDDMHDLEGWLPIQMKGMLGRDEGANSDWQMIGSRNNDLNRDAYIAGLDDDPEILRKASNKAMLQDLSPDEIHEVIAHAVGDGGSARGQQKTLRTKERHRGARLAELYHRLTPDIRNYRRKGDGADFSGLKYLEWSDAQGWTHLKSTEIIAGLRICNNMGKPSLAREALLDLASLKHYGNVQEWDSFDKADPIDKDEYLGLPNCQALCVRTGEIVAQEKDWRILRQLNVAAPDDANAYPELWIECLNTWTNSDLDKMLFLQQLAGYILFGGNPEHRFVYLYGEGANGKSTFLDCLMAIMGQDYCNVMAPAIYEDKTKEHPTVIKALEHKRLLISGEIKPLKSWNTPMIKDITGGNVIFARSMHADPEPMKVVGLPIFQGNHLPVFMDLTEGWGRRVVLVPFDVTISEKEKKPDLIRELLKDAPAIFMWMVQGLRSYLAAGRLKLPDSIEQATEDYLTDFAESNVLSEDLLVGNMHIFLERMKEENKTFFLAEELIEDCGLNIDTPQSRVGYYKIIKKFMLQFGWEPRRITHAGRRVRAYRKKQKE